MDGRVDLCAALVDTTLDRGGGTVGWEAVAMVQPDLAVAQELCDLLAEFKERRELSYEKLGQLALCSKGTVGNYLTKPGHGRGLVTLDSLLTALDVTAAERDKALRLHRLSEPRSPDPETAGWAVAAAKADCTVWDMEQFTPAEATVHPAIRRDRVLTGDPSRVPSPPAYVLREHDRLLREDITAAARGELSAMIALRGGPSTGKTRSLFEAVHALGPEWAVIRPRSAAAVRALAVSGLLDRRRCVLWLNELQAFLGPNGTGLSLDVLRDIFAATGHRGDGRNRSPHPLVIVATLWPEKLRDATASDEHFSDNRDLLISANEWVRWHGVARDFSPRERDEARNLAANTGDTRLKVALYDPDHVGFAQTLAGGHEILQHYLTAPNRMDQLLLDAAGQARLLGHASFLPAPLLRAIATALWREERGQASPPAGWFDTAVAHATQPLRSTQGIQALVAIDSTRDADAGEPAYELADYLEQHLNRTRRARSVADAVWNALRDHAATPDDLIGVARAAVARGRFQYGETLYRAAEDPAALLELAQWLAKLPGREQDAECAFRAAIAAGHLHALLWFPHWLQRQPGREDEVERAFQHAMTAGHPEAPVWLACWLKDQPGREREAIQVFRSAIVTGDLTALSVFAGWRTRQLWDLGKDTNEVVQIFRDAMATGHSGMALEFVQWVKPQLLFVERDEVERAFRDAMATGDSGMDLEFARWLACVFGKGEKCEVERAFRDAIAAGDDGAFRAFAEWLACQAGREDEVERAFRDAIAAGDVSAFRAFAEWLARQAGREEEIKQAYRSAIAAGDYYALSEFVDWLDGQPGRGDQIEQAFRDAIAADGYDALIKFVDWLDRQPGREEEIEQALRDAIADGDVEAFEQFARWLARQPGREEETEQAFRDAIAAGHQAALRGYRKWLASQPSRQNDAEQVASFGLVR